MSIDFQVIIDAQNKINSLVEDTEKKMSWLDNEKNMSKELIDDLKKDFENTLQEFRKQQYELAQSASKIILEEIEYIHNTEVATNEIEKRDLKFQRDFLSFVTKAMTFNRLARIVGREDRAQEGEAKLNFFYDSIRKTLTHEDYQAFMRSTEAISTVINGSAE